MLRKLRAIFCLLILATVAHAEWKVSESRAEFSNAGAVEHRHIVADSTEGENATLELALFSSKSATLRVLDNPEGNGNLAATMQREHCIAGVNGGYFDPEHAPVGLLVSDGRVVAPLRKARLLSGVVSVLNGRVQVQRSSEFSMKAKPVAARQCGPFLVNGGKAIPSLNNTRAARRTFVATSGGDRAAIGYCSHVTLAQLAEVLASPGLASEFKTQRALNLDGGSSSGFWFAGEKGPFSISEYKSVRDYLAVVLK